MDIFWLLKAGEIGNLKLGTDQSIGVAALKQLALSKTVDVSELNGVVVAISSGIEAHFVGGHMSNLVIKMAHFWGKASLFVGVPERKVNRKTSLCRVIKWLHEAGVKWKFVQKFCFGRRVELITEGNASLEFLAEAGHVVINRIHITEGDLYTDD